MQNNTQKQLSRQQEAIANLFTDTQNADQCWNTKNPQDKWPGSALQKINKIALDRRRLRHSITTQRKHGKVDEKYKNYSAKNYRIQQRMKPLSKLNMDKHVRMPMNVRNLSYESSMRNYLCFSDKSQIKCKQNSCFIKSQRLNQPSCRSEKDFSVQQKLGESKQIKKIIQRQIKSSQIVGRISCQSKSVKQKQPISFSRYLGQKRSQTIKQSYLLNCLDKII